MNQSWRALCERTDIHPMHVYRLSLGGEATCPGNLVTDPFTVPPKGAHPTASHFSDGKPAVDQIPPDVLLEWGKVFTMGAKKYGTDNWRKGAAWSEFIASALRHIYKFQMREDKDEESDLSPIAHAIWDLAAVLHYQMNGLGEDDRYDYSA